MKKTGIFMFALALGLTFSINSFAQEKETSKQDVKKEQVEKKAEKKVDIKELQKSDDSVKGEVEVVEDGTPFNTVCPVSGEDIESDHVNVSYNGKTYALCCKKCLKKFKVDPEKYIGRLSEDGKSLNKK